MVKQFIDFNHSKYLYFILVILLVSMTSCKEDILDTDEYVSFDEHPDFLSCSSIEELATDEPSNLSRLRVAGNKIVDNDCNPMVLKGVSLIDPYFIYDVDQMASVESEIKFLAEEWKVKILRLPIHPNLWQISPNYLEDYVDELVELCNKYGIYCFIGWHAHGNSVTGESESPDWKDNPPWTGNPFNADYQLAEDALIEIVTRYQHKPWVIYGSFNEPTFISWEDWQPQAISLIKAMRNIDSNCVIMVSGVNWGYDLNGAIKLPILESNIIYETHPYPWKGESWKNDLFEIDKTQATFLGEWGFGPELSPGRNTQNYGQDLIDYCNNMKIGWTAWIWHYDWTPSILASPNNDPTEFGELVKASLDGN